MDNAGVTAEWGDILRDLNALTETAITYNGKTFVVRSNTVGVAGKIAQCVGVKALFAWHVSPPELQAPAALPCRVLLSVQSSLLAQRDVSPPRIRRPAHCADALPSAQTR